MTLLDYFRYNDWANRKMLHAIGKMNQPDEAVMLFSHLITSQDKWMNRITQDVDDATLTWFGPVYSFDELERRWSDSIGAWLSFLESHADADLENEIVFNRIDDGKRLKVKIKDVAFQLNCHSVHHRAQMARIVREQGQKPPATDYIFTKIEPA